jgi:isoleucyl-tRNA synthetase
MRDKTTDFPKAEAGVDIPALETEILDLWDRTDAFRRQVELRPSDNEYVFYDGPPFPTGSPHYGNLLAGVIKDVVPRYWAMRGYRVERRFGWDTHGLPVEMEVEKRLGISGPRQITEYGIDRFNEECRAEVQANTENWRRITRRLGRWVDFDNDYKTMDTDFMESVWWVFKQLWDKGLIYEDFKVLPYSWGATTPLSNFEANLDYRDTDDPSITVALEVLSSHGSVAVGDRLLIWTTTPWTLPGNLAIAVGPEIEYSRIDLDGTPAWIATERIGAYFPDAPAASGTATGSDLLGVEYRPPFDHFGEERDRGAFRVIESPDVTTTEGTGLVHMAPAYGEADFFALQAAGLDVLVDPVDLEGRFTEAVPEVAGMNIKEADAVLMDLLREAGVLVRRDSIRHSYPFCYRTGTPLIYKAIPTWFVAVESYKDRLVDLNEQIHWVPEYVGSRRFGNWLEGARDWAISRNRYWGSCIPVWVCDTGGHQVCIGSIEELEERSGVRLDDLHKHIVDPVTFGCDECEGTMVRTPEVLDCWFESGSMPYGQLHYPFENAERFGSVFPARFIAEGLDQTRGWFYTLHVLAGALFDQPAFENCVVNGMILAEDGRKMSKSLKNYPDPFEIFDAFGADAARAFMINSPVLRAEPLRFSEDGVREVVRTVLLPLWNTFSFFTTYAQADGIRAADLAEAPPISERSELDRWIVSVLQSLIQSVNENMEGYYLYDVVPPTLAFIGDLTNWYVRRSRRRFWAARTGDAVDDADKLAAFATLYEVLTTFSKTLAPVLPFLTERLYQELVVAVDPDAPVSVHHCDFPQAVPELIDRELEDQIRIVREIVTLGRSIRTTEKLKTRQPLAAATILTHDAQVMKAVADHAELIAEELNVKSVRSSRDESELVELSCKADFSRLGPRFGPRVKEIAAAVAALDADQIAPLLDGGSIVAVGETLTLDDVVISRNALPGVVVQTEGSLAVALDTTMTDELRSEGMAREIVSRVQQIRRDSGFDVTDRITIRWASQDSLVGEAFARHLETISSEVLATEISAGTDADPVVLDGHELALEVSRA